MITICKYNELLQLLSAVWHKSFVCLPASNSMKVPQRAFMCHARYWHLGIGLMQLSVIQAVIGSCPQKLVLRSSRRIWGRLIMDGFLVSEVGRWKNFRSICEDWCFLQKSCRTEEPWKCHRPGSAAKGLGRDGRPGRDILI